MVPVALALLAALSGAIAMWQWWAALRFPLGQRLPVPAALPPVAVLKPVKGADAGTAEALETWFHQEYPGEVEVVFGTETADDPAVPILRELLARHPAVRARHVVCPERLGANRKVSNLIQMLRAARGDLVVVSDADVAAPPGLLAQLAVPLADPGVGIVHCLYRHADAPTPATRWEAFVVNADFWSQVLQNRTLGPLGYALGAALALRREDLRAQGGFEAVADYLADDHQLGRLTVASGRRTELCRLPVDCRVAPADWGTAWRHQLRWAITIRVCQPGPYFLSILANATAWPLLWIALAPSRASLAGGGALLLFRVAQGLSLEARFTGHPRRWPQAWLVPLKDLLQAALWLASFLRHQVIWRGIRFRVRPDGRLTPLPDGPKC